MKSSRIPRILGICALAWTLAPPAAVAEREEGRPLNVLFLTADDLHCESLGSFRGEIPDLTPHLDRLASEGMRFFRAHVNVAICQPSRGVLATGRYGHNSGVMGFMHTERDIPIYGCT